MIVLRNALRRPSAWLPPLRAALVSKLGGNIISLYATQGLNYLLPLALAPYLLRVLGPRGYGGIAFAQSLMAYAVVLTDFGFAFSATRAVALARDDPNRLARIFWTTLAAKGVLLLVASTIILAAVLLFPTLREHAAVIGVCGMAVVGAVLLPQWYFQGLERMRAMAWIQAWSKLLILAPAFVLVRSEADELLAAAVLSVPALLGGLSCLLSVRYLAPIRFYRPSWSDITGALTGGRDFFVSNVATSSYVTSNAFIVGLISGDRAVALYSLANKAALAAFGCLSPVVQASFPRASLLFGRSLEDARSFVRRISVPLVVLAALISIVLLLFAGPIVRLLAGPQYGGAVPVLRILALLPLALTAGTLLAQIVMINLGLTRSLSRIYVSMGLLNLVMLPLLASRLGASGGAISLLSVETLGPVLMAGVIRRAWFPQVNPA
ncbi:MAG TPA: oligosaccharide flippase family protein [Steroidobacteraceae bacterium]|jgi:O-antigen/teichoic acid export membrane protein